LPGLEQSGCTLSYEANEAPALAEIGPQTAAVTGALHLTGGYIEVDGDVPDPQSLNIQRYLTVEVTFKVDEDAFADPNVSWMPLIYKGDGTGSAGRTYSLWLCREGYLHFTSSDAAYGQTWVNTAAGSIVPGKTYHVAGVMDRATSNMYICLDGELVAQKEIPYVAARPRREFSYWFFGWRTVVLDPGAPAVHYDAVSTSNPLRIGGTQESYPNYSNFAGQINEVRIWESVRSPAQIALNMTAELEGNEPGLVALWKFDEPPGDTTVLDSTTKHNDAAIYGSSAREACIKLPFEEPDGQPVFFDLQSDQEGIEVSSEGGSMIVSVSGGFAGTARITVTVGDGTSEQPLGRTDQMQFDYTVAANAIYGTVFLDEDADGQPDESASGLESFTIFLDEDLNGTLDPGERFTYTDANGDYVFMGLLPAMFNVTEIPPPGYWPSNGLFCTPHTFSETNQLAQVDFGNLTAGMGLRLTVSGTAFGPDAGGIWGGATFWVNAYVEDLRHLPEGVVGGAFDLLFDSIPVSPTGNVVYGDDFTDDLQGTPDDSAGRIDEAGATTAAGNIGAGTWAPFVAWEFRRDGAGAPNDSNSQVTFSAGAGEANFCLTDIGVPLPWATVDLGSCDVSLYLGDFTGDAAVNQSDLAEWIPRAFVPPGQTGYDPEFDLNGDTFVNQYDLALWIPRLFQPRNTLAE